MKVVKLVIEGADSTGSATLTIPLPDGTGMACLFGAGRGPHNLWFSQDPDGNPIAIGRSGSQMVEAIISAELS